MMKVFVYGTLKKGYSNHQFYMNDAKFIREATASGFSMVNGPGFPFAFKKKDSLIQGELYEIDETTLKQLDYLESYPSFYTRSEDGPEGSWIYHLDSKPTGKEITSWPSS